MQQRQLNPIYTLFLLVLRTIHPTGQLSTVDQADDVSSDSSAVVMTLGGSESGTLLNDQMIAVHDFMRQIIDPNFLEVFSSTCGQQIMPCLEDLKRLAREVSPPLIEQHGLSWTAYLEQGNLYPAVTVSEYSVLVKLQNAQFKFLANRSIEVTFQEDTLFAYLSQEIKLPAFLIDLHESQQFLLPDNASAEILLSTRSLNASSLAAEVLGSVLLSDAVSTNCDAHNEKSSQDDSCNFTD